MPLSRMEREGFLLEADIPETPIYCRLDRTLLERLLENLVNNAVKYNPAGTTIFVSVREEEKQAVLQFGDDGVGIPPELKSRLFPSLCYRRCIQERGASIWVGLSGLQADCAAAWGKLGTGRAAFGGTRDRIDFNSSYRRAGISVPANLKKMLGFLKRKVSLTG